MHGHMMYERTLEYEQHVLDADNLYIQELPFDWLQKEEKFLMDVSFFFRF